MVTNAVRCVPPANKPTPAEMATCRPFLESTIAALPELKIILALGRVAHESTVRAFGGRLAAYPFVHGGEANITTAAGRTFALFDSYHCSRYNTNTGVLTTPMFHAVFAAVRARLDAG